MNLSRRAAVCFMAAVFAVKSNAQTRRYSEVPRSRDGIGKSYMGREIAGVMGWQGAAWLEREERAQEERGDLLLRKEAAAHALVYERTAATLPWQHVIIFRKP